MVIGGGAAGMSAASAARRVAPDLEVVVCEAGGFAAYGMCGIPYFLGGVVPRAESLLAYPPGEFRGQRGIDLRLNTRVDAIDARTLELLGLSFEIARCPHAGGPPICWCRPPLPGLPLAFARTHGVEPSVSTVIGTGPAHKTLAAALGARYVAI